MGDYFLSVYPINKIPQDEKSRLKWFDENGVWRNKIKHDLVKDQTSNLAKNQ